MSTSSSQPTDFQDSDIFHELKRDDVCKILRRHSLVVVPGKSNEKSRVRKTSSRVHHCNYEC